MATRYVVGFPMSATSKEFGKMQFDVALMKKSHPVWQAGRYNGIGGHIEAYDADPFAAMVREFKEETGLDTQTVDWEHVATIQGGHAMDSERQFQLYVFAIWRVNLHDVARGADVHSPNELVDIVDAGELPPSVLPNLHYLIPMAIASNRQEWPYLIIENGG